MFCVNKQDTIKRRISRTVTKYTVIVVNVGIPKPS